MVSSLNNDKGLPQQGKTLRNKSKGVLLTLMLLMLTTVVLADPGTGLCDGEDGGPDNCPLDTWVWAIAVILATFAVAHLIKRKQRQISDQ